MRRATPRWLTSDTDDLHELRVEPLVREIGVIGLDHAFRVALRDGGGVGVHRVEQELHGDRAPALQVFGVAERNHDAGVEHLPG